MTQPVTEGLYLQKSYSCQIRFLGNITNTLPLECVTLDELKLLAYMHGNEAVADIKHLGMRPTLTFNPDEGAPIYVQDQMGEYMRLARKYDTIVNSGRGKAAVEKCFGIQLVNFDAIINELNAVDEVSRKAAEAEAKTEVSKSGEQRETERKKSADTPQDVARSGSIGSRLAESMAREAD